MNGGKKNTASVDKGISSLMDLNTELQTNLVKWAKVDKNDKETMRTYIEKADVLIEKLDNTLSAAKTQKAKMMDFLKALDTVKA
jgi:hypothetical protein